MTRPDPLRVVVVGASLAGLRSVEALRSHGYDGEIVVVGDESRLPYDRPPLSKQVLAGDWTPEQTLLRDDASLGELAAEWRLGTRAVGLDPTAHSVELDTGEGLTYDGLVIATGAAPRRLPGTDDLAGVYVLRTLDDCLALRAELEREPKVVVVGAGFIGAEVAATCRGRGLAVTVLEALPVPLERVLGARMGEVCAAIHRDNGVDLRLGAGVEGFDADAKGHVVGVRLTDDRVVDADVVVVGIGVAPATDWLAGSGVAVRNGVVCDETCATNAPGVVAAGDVARWPNVLFGEVMRLEHWTNAVEQAEAAARRLVADLQGGSIPEPFAPVPYFWSDQYDRKIQFVGVAAPGDDVAVVHGTTEERQFVALYGRGGRLVGALSLNRPRLLMQYRRLIAQRALFADARTLAESA